MSHRHCATFCVTFLIFLLLNTLPAKCDLHTHGPEEFGIGSEYYVKIQDGLLTPNLLAIVIQLLLYSIVYYSAEMIPCRRTTLSTTNIGRLQWMDYSATSHWIALRWVPSENSTHFIDLWHNNVLLPKQPSSGMISSTYDMDFDKDGIVESNADIYNASSQFNVSMKIESFSSGVSWDTFMLFRRRHRFIKPRSFAMLCEVKAQRLRQTNRKLEFGSRINNDFLVRFERHHVHEKFSEFPSHKFHFFDGGVNINYVKLIYDVSCRWEITTWIHLSLSSSPL